MRGETNLSNYLPVLEPVVSQVELCQALQAANV